MFAATQLQHAVLALVSVLSVRPWAWMDFSWIVLDGRFLLLFETSGTCINLTHNVGDEFLRKCRPAPAC